MTHELKCWPQFFCRVIGGSKLFEVRVNDRGFQPGDLVVLNEFDPNEQTWHSGCEYEPGCSTEGKYTGKKATFKIGYVLPIDEKRVVFSLLKAE